MLGSGPDPQWERGIPWHWPCGSDVEGSDGDFKSLAHILHHLPRLPPWVLVRLRHRYRHPLGQTSSVVIGLDGGGPVQDLTGPAQGVLCLEQVHIPRNPRGLRGGTSSMLAPPEILRLAEDGGEGGRLLRVGV